MASVWKCRDIDHAIEIANSSRFGLGASAWTEMQPSASDSFSTSNRAWCSSNGMVVSELALPFGGVKDSGYGRELGDFGIMEFVNIKSVKIAEKSETRAHTE